MLSVTNSLALIGLDGYLVEVEVDLSRGLPKFEIVGLPDTAVKESKERVRSAIKNSGYPFPKSVITVNLAPADLKKEGAGLDLAIAVGLMRSSIEGLTRDVTKTVFIGEVSLDGSVRATSGILPLVLSAKKLGYKTVVIPKSNEKEAQYVDGVDILAVQNLKEVTEFLAEKSYNISPVAEFKTTQKIDEINDFSLVKGQFMSKRAMEVAVSGGHNVLMIGPPGSGKSMLAKCIPSIMPDFTFEEALETTKIHSVAGVLDAQEGIVSIRPFITPHHTATNIALIGGGVNLRPGLISLAHNGVLYLDEMPEYQRSVLECLRQPLEDRIMTVSRAKGSIKYPANFMLCASMNPCPCGNLGSETQECRCSQSQIRKYRAKISGPLLDRIDLQIQVDGVEYDDLTSGEEVETSRDVKKRVNQARLIQRERFKDDGINTNAEMSEVHIQKYCVLNSECEKIMKKSYQSLGLSARGRSRIIKVARTIADLDFSDEILPKHLLEAINYRSMDINDR